MSDKTVDYVSSELPEFRPGPYLAKVVSIIEASYMGILEVKLQRPVGNNDAPDQLFTVRYMSPFWGQTSVDYIAEDPNDYNNTQKSYGMWFVPPDVGTTVMVIFIDGNTKAGYWIGCVPDESMNFMVPGIAATKFAIDANGKRLPVAEYNKSANKQVQEATKVQKPQHNDQIKFLEEQGLLLDDIRGITTSSARRELPSSVFGISTPGPVDKRSGAKKGKVGKEGFKVDAYVSRLGGTTFVMDDGDDKFLRKTHAKDGPPEYAAMEQGETGGKPDIPHNELVRIRTRTGHQILLHNSEDLIYITNSRGTAWIELTSNVKIDIYAADSISMHTEKDFNVTAKNNINLTSLEGSINLNAKLNFNATAAGSWNIKATSNGNLTASGTTSITGSSSVLVTGGTIDLNGPTATQASEAIVAPRVPQHEPWAGHENLHNTTLKYTTSTDTFEQVKPAENP